MGREERRRQERLARLNGNKLKTEQPVLKRFTKDEFQQFVFDIDYQARLETIDMMMTAFALAEHRVHKFGHTRVERTLNYVDQMMDDIVNKKATWEQYKEECLNEVGWKFVNKTDEESKGVDINEVDCR